MSAKSCLSYHIPRSDCDPINLCSGVYVKAVCVNEDVARLFLCDQNGAPVAIQVAQDGKSVFDPLNCVLKNTSTKRNVRVHNSEWLISWSACYEIWNDESLILSIQSERRHNFTHARDM